jgi:hypothetical protein
VKNFTSPSFFRLFDLLTSTHNPGFRHSKWTLDGVDCARERHSFTGQQHGFAVEIFTLTRPGKRNWSLMVVKEYWWIGQEGRDTKVLRWARPTGGRRDDIIAWFREQDAILERSSALITQIGPTREQTQVVGTPNSTMSRSGTARGTNRKHFE